MIYEGVSPSYLPNNSYDLRPKYNIYIVIYREMGTFLPHFTPVCVPFDPFFGPIITRKGINMPQLDLVTVFH